MKISFHKKFKKQFLKLSSSDKKAVIETIKTFQEDPFDPKLKNHALKGKLKNERSISVRFDLRLIYKEISGLHEIIFLRAGQHKAVY